MSGRISGSLKQLVAEVVGDGYLADEGRADTMGLTGKDKQQDRLQDKRKGAADPVKGRDAAPEGLKRKRKGPLNKTIGRR
jgi:hypothetical protein